MSQEVELFMWFLNLDAQQMFHIQEKIQVLQTLRVKQE